MIDIGYFLFNDSHDKILFAYPSELCHEKILQESLKNVKKYIREYIKEMEAYEMKVKMLTRTIWDSQRNKVIDEADEQRQNMLRLLKYMNEGISPYSWEIRKGNRRYIDGIYYNPDYVVVLAEQKIEL